MGKVKIGQAKCIYCGYITTTGGIRTHMRYCSENPKREKRSRVVVASKEESEEFFKKLLNNEL